MKLVGLEGGLWGGEMVWVGAELNFPNEIQFEG